MGVKLDISSERKIEKEYTYMAAKYHITNEWVKQDIKEEIKYMKTNEKENTVIQNLLVAAKAVFRGRFRAIQIHLKNQEKSQTHHITYPYT